VISYEAQPEDRSPATVDVLFEVANSPERNTPGRPNFLTVVETKKERTVTKVELEPPRWERMRVKNKTYPLLK
jgi:hypothetical protein